MKTLIKICGLKDEAAINAAAHNGATHIGLVHFEKSPRHVTLQQAAALRTRTPRELKVVLLLVNAEILPTLRALDMVKPDIIQFHGSETPEWLALLKQKSTFEIWKAFGVRDAEGLERSRRYHGAVDRILYDAPAQALPGGTGTRFDWSLLANHSHSIPWGMAGGLSPDNVEDALHATHAPLVDVSSGVESAPGVKDIAKIAAFCEAVRRYDSR